jgi:FKBP-type peptidyl-prolyl cis-trans isomerase SlyD
MIISENKVISIIYQLRKDNAEGEIVEELSLDNPLTFMFGRGNLLPKFEENLNGLKKGDSFQFHLESEEAYGAVMDNAIVDVPIDIFKVNGEIDYNFLQTGNTIPMLDSQGRRLNGIVMDLSEDSVKMDFNHPMAGTDLFFKGEVTAVREANEDELAHGHIHSEHSCHGCDKEDCHSKHENAEDHDHGHDHQHCH